MALSPKKIPYSGQPLDIGVPGAGFDRRQAVRAWEIAVRLREQARTFRQMPAPACRRIADRLPEILLLE